jgi:hypothetical protein
MTQITPLFPDPFSSASVIPQRAPSLLLLDDDPVVARQLEPICEFLDVSIEYVSPDADLNQKLQEFNPMGGRRRTGRDRTGWVPCDEACRCVRPHATHACPHR